MTTWALLNAISSVFDRVLECSLQAGLVILIVLVIRAAVGRRLSGRWLHALWLIAMLRLALPWVPATHWNPLGRLPAIHWTGAATPPAATVSPIPDRADADSDDLSPSLLWSAPSPSPVEPVASQHRPATVATLTPRHVVCLVWISGAVALGTFIGWNVARLRRAIVRERLLTDASILNLLEDCKRQMGVAIPVGIVITDKTGSPALFGFLRPRLLMPPGVLENLKHDELRHVFLHELAHLRRHDVLISWIMCILQLFHWCNPLVWLAQSRMRADRELACDAMALSVLRAREPQEYGNTIVRLLEQFSRPQYIPALTGILEQKSQLKRRIAMIAEFKPQSHIAVAFALVLSALVALLALTTSPGMAASAADSSNASAAAPDVSKPKTFSPGKVYTITPGKGLDIIQVGATADQVKAVLGPPETVDPDGRRMVYHKKASMDFWFDRSGGRVSEIRFNPGFHGRMESGVRLGSHLDMVLDKSGGAKKTVNASHDETHGCRMGMDRVLYNQKQGTEVTGYKFVDGNRGVLYWFNAEKELVQIVVLPVGGSEATQAGKVQLPAGSRIDEHGNLVDKMDWPFVDDPDVIGKWESVDYLRRIEDFQPGEPKTTADRLFIKGMVFEKAGKANFGFLNWTQGLVLHQPNKTAAKYVIKKIGDTAYLFMEWKSGDYVIRHQTPWYYVLKKLPADSPKFKNARELMDMDREVPEAKLGPDSHIDGNGNIVDKIDYPFVSDPEAIGIWESVDFVDQIADFKPDQRHWKGDLFLKELVFTDGGKLGPRGRNTWTKGLVLSPGDHTASKYEIKDLPGGKYMFFEWKSGDYKVLHRRPSYYVLRRRPAGGATKGNAAAEKAAIESAQAWLEFVDAGNYAKSWEEGATLFKSAVSQEDLEKSLRAARTPLGKVISRKVKSQQYAKVLPGAPDGEYVVIQYQTRFEDKADATETVTPMLDKDGKWRVSGYYIK